MRTLSFALAILFSTVAVGGEIADLHRKHIRPQEGNKQAEQQRFDQMMAPNHKVTEIGIERTECFGDCPVYTFVIQANGKFRYHGVKNVDKLGQHVGVVDPWELDQLAQYIVDSGYLTLKSTYTVPVTDMPTTYTTVVRSGQRKLISNYGGVGPTKLWAIEQLIDNLLQTAQWGPNASFD